MSTIASTISPEHPIASDLHTFLDNLEDDASLFKPRQLLRRLIALDDLDAIFGCLDFEDPARCTDSQIHHRAHALRTQLEAANTHLYQYVRSEIIRGGHPQALLQSLHDSTSQSSSPSPGPGFDCQDELLSGVLQLTEPTDPNLPQPPEMVPYQPTPVRHILHLIAATALAADDVFIDLGSGLGHVPLLVSILTHASSVGIEVQPAHVASAKQCAQSLHLKRVHFILQDARQADLSTGTIFYLYSPFKGSILTEVLSALRTQSTHRPIRICSLGPCTRTIANQSWLQASAPPDTGRITVFHSQ